MSIRFAQSFVQKKNKHKLYIIIVYSHTDFHIDLLKTVFISIMIDCQSCLRNHLHIFLKYYFYTVIISMHANFFDNWLNNKEVIKLCFSVSRTSYFRCPVHHNQKVMPFLQYQIKF